jgi:ferredoxin
VVVDRHARTEDPRVYAVGDMTRRPLDLHEGLFRLESIPSAVEQARQAVAAILGQPAPPPEVPWFWSDQFDLKLQIAGLTRPGDETIVRADPEHRRLAVFHLRDGRLGAVEAVNATAEFMAGKRLIRDQVALDRAALADPAVALDRVALAPAGGSAAAATQDTPAAPAPSSDAPDAPDAGDGAELPGPGGKVGEPLVTYVQHDGDTRSVNVPVGLTVMDGSVRNNLPGIIAECGGMCSCGTCHVYVDEPFRGLLPDPEMEEEDLLEFIDDRQDGSRLSCQLVLTDELDGLVVRVPRFEG